MTEVFLDENNLIGIKDNEHITNNECFLDISGNVLKSINCKLLALYRGKFHIKELKNIGDGMNIFRLLERQSLDENWENLDTDALVDGMSIYQEFNEEIGKTEVYLYKFPKDEIEYINEILQDFGIEGRKVELKGRFVQMVGNNMTLDQINSNIDKWIAENDTVKLLSFLMGIMIVYGDFDVDGEILHNIKIDINIGGLLLGKNLFLERLIGYFANLGIYMSITKIDKDIGSLYQISISDDEILSVSAMILGEYLGITSVSTRTYNNEAINSMIAYLDTFNITGADEIIDELNDGMIIKVYKC